MSTSSGASSAAGVASLLQDVLERVASARGTLGAADVPALTAARDVLTTCEQQLQRVLSDAHSVCIPGELLQRCSEADISQLNTLGLPLYTDPFILLSLALHTCVLRACGGAASPSLLPSDPSLWLTMEGSTASLTQFTYSHDVRMACLRAGDAAIVHVTRGLTHTEKAFTLSEWTSVAAAGVSSVRGALDATLQPLWTPSRSADLRSRVAEGLVKPLLPAPPPAAAVAASSSTPAALPPQQQQQPGSSLRVPDRARMPDVGARDLMPDFGPGAPGYLLDPRGVGGVGQGGSLVGPDHPLFAAGPGRFAPPSHPAGARFDPFMPPGMMPPGGLGPGMPRGPRPGGSSGFGPNPDHLRPPRGTDFDDAPPDIYW